MVLPLPARTAMRAAVRAALRTALLDALAVLLPVSCVACGAFDRAVCDACARELEPRVRRWTAPGNLPVWAALENTGVVAAGMRAIKDEGRTELLGAFAPALRAAVRTALGETGSLAPASVRLVAIPSSRNAFRRRGFRPVDALLSRARLRASGLLAAVRGQHDDQRLLGREERALNVRGAFRMRVRLPPSELTVLLVDDVLTTGATVAEAAAVLRAGGARVIGAAVLARTPRRSETTPDPNWE